MIWTLLLLTAAVLCFSIKELAAHGKLEHWGIFWSGDSWVKKYKVKDGQFVPAPKNWYYKLFDITYKERWPTSATLTVAVTDGEHLAQAAYKLFLALSFYPWVGWIWAGVIWLTWGISFTIFYKLLSR